MSRFFTKTLGALTPYTPGEQPQDMKYVKLNTNESPFEPSKEAKCKANENLRALNLYPDPDGKMLKSKLAEVYGVGADNVVLGNGSDELLFFAFKGFCDEDCKALFPDITYGFYPVFANINRVPYEEIPLTEDLSIDIDEYKKRDGTVFIANPNAPTGKALGLDAIEDLAKSKPDNVIVVDEAYVDFGAQSAVPLVKTYKNLLVIQTFSKSRSLAGARIGFAIGDEELIRDINTLRNSFNPYNINSMTMSIAYGVLCDEERVKENCRKIEENREYTEEKLKEMGFEVIDSKANFIFAKSDRIGGEELYKKLKERGVLIRHFTKDRIKDYNRITIGKKEEMDILFEKIREILDEA